MASKPAAPRQQKHLAVLIDADNASAAIGPFIRLFDKGFSVEDVRQALFASKIVAYSQGFDEIAAGAAEHGWDIAKGDVAKIWRAGCIIRAQFLGSYGQVDGLQQHVLRGAHL